MSFSHYLVSFSFISFSVLVFAVRFKQIHSMPLRHPEAGNPCLLAQQWRKGVERGGGGLAFQEVSPCSLWLPENVQSQIRLLPVAM